MDTPSCYNAFLAGLTTDEIFIVMESLANLSPCEYPSQSRMLNMAKTEIVYRRARRPTEQETKDRFQKLNAWIVPPCCETCARLFRALVDLIDSIRSKRRPTLGHHLLQDPSHMVWLDSLPRSKSGPVRVSTNG